MDVPRTAVEVVGRLRGLATLPEREKLAKRLPAGEAALGVRMRDLFDTAKLATALPDRELDALFAEESYEARMAAFCILDFRARKAASPELRRRYVDQHDRITTWDMVDRAAPWVVGAPTAGGPYDLLDELAASGDPLRRRTAITAPLWFARYGAPADLEAGYAVAQRLRGDPEVLVRKAVAIYEKHAARRR